MATATDPSLLTALRATELFAACPAADLEKVIAGSTEQRLNPGDQLFDDQAMPNAVWVVLEGNNLVTSLAGIRQKLKNLVARPQATVFVIDPSNPYRTLEVRCDVTIEPDPDLGTLSKVLRAYGTDLASFQAPLEGRVRVTLNPVHAVALG